jgi:hypothetical protein
LQQKLIIRTTNSDLPTVKGKQVIYGQS